MSEKLLSEEEFWQRAGKYKDSLDIEFVKTIDSTNSELLRRLEKNLCKEPFLLASEMQTAGHGRVGRKFYSPQKDGIYFSYTRAFDQEKRDISFYTTSAAVGLCRAIKKVYGAQCSIKWVNDIYLGGRKIAGILAEGFVSPQSGKLESIVTGIGINLRLNQTLLTQEDSLALQRAGGIEDFADKKGVSPTLLLATCIDEIFSILDSDPSSTSSPSSTFMEEYKSLSMLTGKTVSVTSLASAAVQSYKAKVLGISDDAGLVVQTEDGSVRTLRSGEVSLHESKLD